MKHLSLFNRATISLGSILLILSAGQAQAGKITLPDGSQCEGESVSGTLNGKPEGTGTMTFADKSTYKGSFKAGQFTGQGTRTYKNGNTYTGSYLNGKPDGKGLLTLHSCLCQLRSWHWRSNG